MHSRSRFVRTLVAGATVAISLGVGAPAALAAPYDFVRPLPNHRPIWDPTKVLEMPVDPEHAEGSVDSVTFTDDATGSHHVTVNKTSPTYVRVVSEASGFTPGLYYTVRITLREAGTGDDWGVYTWQTYRATADGKIHINLRLHIPSRAQSGEKIVASPAVYSADKVRRDGRPFKLDEKCVLECKRVPPLARYGSFTDPNAVITIK